MNTSVSVLSEKASQSIPLRNTRILVVSTDQAAFQFVQEKKKIKWRPFCLVFFGTYRENVKPYIDGLDKKRYAELWVVGEDNSKSIQKLREKALECADVAVRYFTLNGVEMDT